MPPRRDTRGDSWQCRNPECRDWTWTATSTLHCFRCGAPAPITTVTRHGHSILQVDLGHRDKRGFVPPGGAAGAADPRLASARLAQPGTPGQPAAPRSGSRGPAGGKGVDRRVPTPPPPPRGHSRGPARDGAPTPPSDALCRQGLP